MVAIESTPKTLSASLAERAAVFDVSDFGRLRVAGDDAIDLLDRLSTNDLRLLTPGGGMGSVLTTNKGRIIDLLRLLKREDDLLALTSPGTQARVAEWIDFYTFGEDVSVEDIGASTTHLLIVGRGAADAATRAGFAADALSDALSHASDGDGGTAVRVEFGSLPAFELILPAGDARAELGLPALDASDLARLRVEQGVAAYPNEMNEAHNPLEANLAPHISFNKGCYIGQEVVARLNTYDKVQRFLCRLSVDDGSSVERGARIAVDGAVVGEVTTAAPGMALAYLRKRAYADGATVDVRDGDRTTTATVRDIRRQTQP